MNFAFFFFPFSSIHHLEFVCLLTMMTTTTTATANEPTNTLTIKALLVGDSDVGKTCSILALQGSEEYDLNAVECYDLCITLKALDSNKSKKLVICVQDTAGDPSFDEIRQCYYSCSNNLVIMFFSLISKPSLDNIKIKVKYNFFINTYPFLYINK